MERNAFRIVTSLSNAKSSQQFIPIVLLLYGSSIVAIMVRVATLKGPWYDEFWSYYFSDPTINLKSAFLSRWTLDVHPPLFSWLAWLSFHVLPRSIEAGRLLNLVPLVICAGYVAWFWRRNSEDRPFLAAFLPSLATLDYCIEAFSEFRSYFAATCSFAVLLIVLRRFSRTGTSSAGTDRIMLWGGLLTALAVCLNIHYMTALLSAAIVAVFGIAAGIEGRWRIFFAYAAAGTVLALPLVAFALYQQPFLKVMLQDYWLKTSIPAATRLLVAVLVHPLIAGLVSGILWTIALILRSHCQLKNAADDKFARTLLFATAAAALATLVYVGMTGALTLRYLIPLTIVALAGLASTCAEVLAKFKLLYACILVANLVSAVATARALASDPNWNQAAQFVAQRQRQCPGSRIAPMQSNPNDNTPNKIANYNSAYQYLAHQWHMTVGPVDLKPNGKPDPHCADYYWADNLFAANKSPAAMKKELLRRFPFLQGCTIDVTKMEAYSAVFAVSGNAPGCTR